MKLLSNDELMHHGIAGQRWGQRNGPPYPLAPNKHSASEKKAGWQKSLSGGTKITNDGHTSDRIMRDLANIALGVLYLNPVRIADATVDIGVGVVSEAKDRKIYKAIQKNQNVDDKTGFKLKNKEMTPEEDMKMINPARRAFTDGSKSNCMLCTTAYDLRRRGYDVMAGMANEGKPTPILKEWYKGAKIEKPNLDNEKHKDAIKLVNDVHERGEFEDGERTKFCNALYELKKDKAYRKELAHTTLTDIAKQGDGARGNLMVTWADGFGGHSMIYEVKEGKTIIRDAQINRTFEGEKAEKLLQRTINTLYCRTDNLEINPEKIKEAIRE